jgi:hypothetical protein
MNLRHFVIVPAVVTGLAGSVLAQAPAVVQLPSISTFGVNTSVSVPDRGSTSLGGVGRSSNGSTAFGPSAGRGNRSAGSSLSANRNSVHAQIHDAEEMDRQMLARAKGGSSGKSGAEADAAQRRLATARRSSAGQVPSGSVAEARRQRAAELAAQRDEATESLKRAREAAAAGKTSLAAAFYRQAGRLAAGDLKSQIDREAAAQARQSKAAGLAKSRPEVAQKSSPER